MGEEEREKRYDNRLSPYQCRIIALLHEWYTPEEIAEQLKTTRDTIYKTVYNARKRMGMDSTAALMRATRQTLGRCKCERD